MRWQFPPLLENYLGIGVANYLAIFDPSILISAAGFAGGDYLFAL
jgi:hypothetical protein